MASDCLQDIRGIDVVVFALILFPHVKYFTNKSDPMIRPQMSSKIMRPYKKFLQYVG